MFCKMNITCRWSSQRFLNIYVLTMQLCIKVIQFWTFIVSMISITKWQCQYCNHYCFYHYYSHYFINFIIISIIIIIIIFTMFRFFVNAPGLRDPFVMQVLPYFWWILVHTYCLSRQNILGWDGFSGARYRGYVSPKLHVSTYWNQQHCWWFSEWWVPSVNSLWSSHVIECHGS